MSLAIMVFSSAEFSLFVYYHFCKKVIKKPLTQKAKFKAVQLNTA